MKKQDEYRVHIFKDKIIDTQKKGKRRDVEEANYRIRNVENGFIYMRENIEPPKILLDTAILAFSRFDLDFGAVDMIWNARNERAYALEINTAPGLEGSTVESYKEAFEN